MTADNNINPAWLVSNLLKLLILLVLIFLGSLQLRSERTHHKWINFQRVVIISEVMSFIWVGYRSIQ